MNNSGYACGVSGRVNFIGSKISKPLIILTTFNLELEIFFYP